MAFEDVGAFAIGADEAAAVDFDAAVLADEAELDGVPEEASDALQSGFVVYRRAQLPVVRQEIGENRVGVHGNVAEDVVEDVRLRRVFEGVAAAQPGGGGKLAA